MPPPAQALSALAVDIGWCSTSGIRRLIPAPLPAARFAGASDGWANEGADALVGENAASAVRLHPKRGMAVLMCITPGAVCPAVVELVEVVVVVVD